MRVWFNHWFSKAYHLIDLIKEGDPGRFTVIGSSTNGFAIYQRACDEWYAEPDGLGAEEYAAFCLEFCRNHHIDSFAPRRDMAAVVAHSNDLDALGVTLMADTDAARSRLLDNRCKTYEFFKAAGFSCVPEFDAAYQELKAGSARVCYKLVADEGPGVSAWSMTDWSRPRPCWKSPE